MEKIRRFPPATEEQLFVATVWNRLTDPSQTYVAEAYTKFYETYCRDAAATTTLTLVQIESVALVVLYRNGTMPHEPASYTVTQHNIEDQTEQDWCVQRVDDFKHAHSVGRTFTLQTHSASARLHLTHEGTFWEVEGVVSLPQRCYSPEEIEYEARSRRLRRREIDT